jgi:hypothetical protein
MLIQFKVGNFRSFRDEQSLDLTASNDKLLVDNILVRDKHRLVKAAAIFGPNASGKSNLFKAIRFMHRFVESSATQTTLGDSIPGISPFRLSSECLHHPASFEVTALIAGVKYRYGFSATESFVIDEWLEVTRPGGRRRMWLDRSSDPGRGETMWSCKGPLQPHEKLLKERTRDNGLALSRAAEMNIKEVGDLFLWFKNNLWTMDLSSDLFGLAQQTAKRLSIDPEFKRRAVKLMQDADLGISDIAVSRGDAFSMLDRASGVLRYAAEGYRMLARAAEAGTAEHFDVHVVRASNDNRAQVRFNLNHDESNGTRRFFGVVGPILDAVQQGATLVVDELECGIHPLLARKLIELFQSPEVNTSGAQLIFTTHDSTLMDLALFRRDQIWMTSKLSDGSTELYSLYDIEDRPRNNEATQKNYLDGRYGGVPQFGPSFEDLQIS